MSSLFSSILSAPDTAPPWEALAHQDWWLAMAECPQDVTHHAEGNLAIHTRMTMEALQQLPAWQALPETDRGILMLAALLHDIGKLEMTVIDEDGRISSAGHSRRGAILARRLLWEAGDIPFAIREAVCSLIRWHQRPLFIADSETPTHAVLMIAETCRCDHLAILAEADARGSISLVQEYSLQQIARFAEMCQERSCFSAPYPFASAHSRFLYFRRPGRAPDYLAYDDTVGEVVLLCGLPEAGREELVHTGFADWPVVSQNDLQARLNTISDEHHHISVFSAAKESARTHLQRGESFVWNATNISRDLRDTTLDLAAEHGFRTRIVYVETPPSELQSSHRGKSIFLAEPPVDQMLGRWEVPDHTEAHIVEYSVHG